MPKRTIEEFIKARAVKTFEKGSYSGRAPNPYAKIEGKESWAEMWEKFYNERAEQYERLKEEQYGDQYIEQPQEVLDIIEANKQNTLRDMMIYRYAKLVYDRNESGYAAVDIPDFSIMSDEELLNIYDDLHICSGMPRG